MRTFGRGGHVSPLAAAFFEIAMTNNTTNERFGFATIKCSHCGHSYEMPMLVSATREPSNAAWHRTFVWLAVAFTITAITGAVDLIIQLFHLH